MKYGVLWRTKNLFRLLIDKCGISLVKPLYVWAFRVEMKKGNQFRAYVLLKILKDIDDAIENISYGIKRFSRKSSNVDSDVDWLERYNLADAVIATEIRRLLSLYKNNNYKD